MKLAGATLIADQLLCPKNGGINYKCYGDYLHPIEFKFCMSFCSGIMGPKWIKRHGCCHFVIQVTDSAAHKCWNNDDANVDVNDDNKGVGVIGWAELIGLWLVKTSHVFGFVFDQRFNNASWCWSWSWSWRKSCAVFQDFCCNSWRQWARHTMAFCESICHNPVIS